MECESALPTLEVPRKGGIPRGYDCLSTVCTAGLLVKSNAVAEPCNRENLWHGTDTDKQANGGHPG